MIQPAALVKKVLRAAAGKSIRSRLVIGVALVHAVLMTLFIADLVHRQRAFLRTESTARALGLARLVAVNSVSWVLANDVRGLSEVIRSVGGYPDVLYAMVIDGSGKVLGHTEEPMIDRYVIDPVSRGLLDGAPEAREVVSSATMMEAAAPIRVGGRVVGWARIAVNQSGHAAELRAALREGVIYTISAILVGTLFALWIARRLTRDLGHLGEAANRLRRGESGIAALQEPPTEIADLERAFADMAGTILRREQELRQYIDKLAASNADLEQFAYVASHDLKTPLRSVASYAQLLERRYGGRLDADADDFIKFIVDGSKRMSVLIDDLLEYARNSQAERDPTGIAAAEAVEAALANLNAAITASGARIHVGSLPTLLAERPHLVSLFQNLIGNALKFRHPERVPEVTITAEPDCIGYWRLAVTDNGLGIAPEYREKIFAIFQRLDAAAEGTGIGLAICRRIVQRMGGRLWIEAAPGEGSIFFFTAPAAVSTPPSNAAPGCAPPASRRAAGAESDAAPV